MPCSSTSLGGWRRHPRLLPCQGRRGLRRFVGLMIFLAAFGGSLGAQSSDSDTQDSNLGLRRDLPAPVGSPRSGTELEELTQEVSEQLRCPMCQGMSVADSPSASAVAIKEEVRALLAEGYSEEQVQDYFEGTYGEFVLLSPKREGLNWFLWLAPVALFFGGLGWILLARRKTTPSATDDDQELDPYLQQVRQLAESETPADPSGS